MPICDYQPSHCAEQLEVRKIPGADDFGLSCAKWRAEKVKRCNPWLFSPRLELPHVRGEDGQGAE